METARSGARMGARWWRRSARLRLKRSVDVVGAGAGLVALAPVVGAASVAIAATMGRPLLFKQTRTGFEGAPFVLWKFRTMRAAVPGEDWARTDEVRVTRVGRWLRRTSIDELPTLVNVLRGDMTLVGPRPLVVEYWDRYTAEQKRRANMPPGVTGWAQINGRESIPFSKRIELDLWYVDHHSTRLDLKILLKTLRVALSAEHVDTVLLDEVDDLGVAQAPNLFVVGEGS